jgi:class 3 adenylate cyclase
LARPSTKLDPEDMRLVIGAYHKCVAETVARFDGFLAKYMGDGVLVYFGYPQAHEDDGVRRPDDLGILNLFETNIAGPVHDCGKHGHSSSFKGMNRRRGILPSGFELVISLMAVNAGRIRAFCKWCAAWR